MAKLRNLLHRNGCFQWLAAFQAERVGPPQTLTKYARLIPVITEIAYLLKRDLGPETAADFIASLSSTPLILAVPEPNDYQRAAELMRQYADANLDFVDALIAALAERLNIIHILTLDQQDFRLIRPRHCDAFEILP